MAKKKDNSSGPRRDPKKTTRRRLNRVGDMQESNLEQIRSIEKAMERLAKSEDFLSKSVEDRQKAYKVLLDQLKELINRSLRISNISAELKAQYVALGGSLEDINKEHTKLSKNLNRVVNVSKRITAQFSKWGVPNDEIEEINSSLESITKNIGKAVKGSKGLKDVWSNITEEIRNSSDHLNTLGSALSTGGIVFGFKQLWNITQGLNAQIEDTANNLRTSVAQGAELVHHARKLVKEESVRYATVQSTLQQQSAMVSSYGAMAKLSPEITDSLAHSSMMFGHTNKQAGELLVMMKNLTGASNETAAMMQKTLGYLSDMSGIAPGVITDDMLNNAGTLAKYFYGSAESMIRSVYEARRLGLTLGDMESLSSGINGNLEDIYRNEAIVSIAFDTQFSL